MKDPSIGGQKGIGSGDWFRVTGFEALDLVCPQAPRGLL